ncbi:MAG TPA: hypothetical protein VGN97_21775 [Mesorhizobium sp.]|jgi:hypothetical protein|nr:hypothetical protein [Mesorhizobium sp.]
MPRYACSYVSDGILRSAVIRAGSLPEAVERMERLPWAEGCGPAGRPRRLPDRTTVNLLAALSLFGVALAASSALVGLPGEILLSELVPWTLRG